MVEHNLVVFNVDFLVLALQLLVEVLSEQLELFKGLLIFLLVKQTAGEVEHHFDLGEHVSKGTLFYLVFKAELQGLVGFEEGGFAIIGLSFLADVYHFF